MYCLWGATDEYTKRSRAFRVHGTIERGSGWEMKKKPCNTFSCIEKAAERAAIYSCVQSNRFYARCRQNENILNLTQDELKKFLLREWVKRVFLLPISLSHSPSCSFLYSFSMCAGIEILLFFHNTLCVSILYILLYFSLSHSLAMYCFEILNKY